MTFLKLHNIKKSYSARQSALDCPSLEIAKGNKIGISGETGSGKSTMLKVISGLEKPDHGKVLLKDENVYPSLDRLIPGHPEMAYLSQSFELPKFISVFDFLDRNATKEDIDQTAAMCRITDLLANDTRSLSGGERQRVALAKILLKEPQVLLLDEPFSNLDPHHKRIIKEVIKEVGEHTNATILMVSHEPTDLLPWADQVVVLKAGKIVQKGTPQNIYKDPEDEYVAGLFGAYQIIEGGSWAQKDQKLIVRPEQFQLNNHGKIGEVTGVFFQGKSDLLTVSVNGKNVFVTVPSGQHQNGDKVKVSLKIGGKKRPSASK